MILTVAAIIYKIRDLIKWIMKIMMIWAIATQYTTRGIQDTIGVRLISEGRIAISDSHILRPNKRVNTRTILNLEFQMSNSQATIATDR